jgi:arginase family enzyme
MLTFGGDHYITYPLLAAHVEKLGRPAMRAAPTKTLPATVRP